MSEIGLTIGGDPSGALAAIGAVKAALAGLQGKTITVDVKTSMDKALGDLGSVAKASNSAADAARDHGRAADDAARSVRDHAAASDAAAASARDHATANDRAASSARGAANWFQDVAKWMDQAGQSAVHASSSMDSLGASSTSAGNSARALSSGAARASSTMQELGGNAQRADRFMVDAGGSATKVSSSLAPLSAGSSRAAIGMGNFASETGRASAAADDGRIHISAMGRTLNDIGGSGGGGGMRALESGIKSVASAADSASGSGGLLGGISGTVGEAGAGVLGAVTGGLRGVGMAALYSSAGMGILGAAVAGVGLAGVAGDFAKSGALMSKGKDAIHDFGQEFQKQAGAATAAGLPMMGALSTAVRSLGHEMASIGVDNMAGAIRGVTSLTNSAAVAAQKLAPAIAPSMDAVFALGNAALGAFGNSGGTIAQFANTVTANAPALQSATESVIRGASTMAQGTVNTIAALAPAMEFGANALAATSDVISGASGGAGHASQQPGPDGSVPEGPSIWSTIGRVLTGAGTGAVLGAGLGAPALGIGAIPGALGGAVIGGTAAYASGPTGVGPGAAQPTSGGVITQAQVDANPSLVPAAGAPGSLGYAAAHGGNAFPSAAESAPPPPSPASTPPGATPNTPAETAAQQSGAAAFGQSSTPSAADAAKTAAPPPPPPSSPAATGGFGSGAPTATSTAQVQALNTALAQTPTAMNAAGAAGAQMGSQMAAGMQQAGSSAQPAAQQVSQGAQQMAQAAPQAAAAAAAPPPPPPPAAAPPKPPPAAPAAAAVAKTTASVAASAAPAASAGGESIGASIGGGMGKGVTKEITNTLTIVKKWIVKVISTAAGALDAHSPSRVFASLGQSIPDGLVVGMEANSSKAISATQSMISQVTAGAQSQLGSAQAQLGKAFTAAYTPPAQTQAQQDPRQLAPQPVRQQDPPKPAERFPQMNPQKRAEDEKKKQDEDRKKEEADRKAATFEANKKGLEERGLTPASAERKAKLEQAHNEKAKQLRDRRQIDKDSAILRARGETPLNTGNPESDNAANRAKADAATNKIKQRDANKDAALKLLGVRPQTDAEKAAAPPPPGSSKAKDLADKRAKSDANAVAAKNTLKNFPGVEGGVKQSANAVGKALPEGMTGGINASAGGPADAAGKMAGAAIDAAKKKTKTKSPSQEFHDIGKSTAEGMANGMNAGAGLASGIGAGISEASNAIQGIADDRGLQIGYRYAQSMVSGINSVLKSDDFKAAAIPQIDSPQAKAALGDMGLLGPAGSGAQVWKSVMVSMGAGTPAAPPAINLTLTLDGDPFRQLVLNQQDNLVSALLNQLKLQKN